MVDNEIKDLNVAELRALAKMFAVDLDGITRKTDIIKEIEDMGVTWDMYLASVAPSVEDLEPTELPPEPTEPLPVVVKPIIIEPTVEPPVENLVEALVVPEEPELFIIKKTRTNPTYEIRGYKFTDEHPFALVSEADANYLIETVGGFRIATPAEASQYYLQ